jgi:hypothetical protein
LFAAPAQAQQSTTVTLKLTVDQINLLVGHLEGKWSELNPVVQDILVQTQAQLRPPPPVVAKPPEKSFDKSFEGGKDEAPK